MLRFVSLLLLCCALIPSASAQNPVKTDIYIACSCSDTVGSRYATALRDVIARSPRYNLAAAAPGNWALFILTLDENPNNKGVSTAISIVFTYNDMMITHHLQTCGSDVVEKCADITLASIDSDIQDLVTAAQNAPVDPSNAKPAPSSGSPLSPPSKSRSSNY